MKNIILLIIFTAHLIAFAVLYLRYQLLYQALFTGGFSGLVIYYGINIIWPKAPVWLPARLAWSGGKIFRYLGLILLAIGTPLFIYVRPVLGSIITGIILLFLVAKFINLKRRLMTNPRFIMFVMRVMLAWLKFRDKFRKNQPE
ncbi:MAG: hypothetical protein WC980_07315 [Candidatus Brocadiia bacterium]